jgi:acetyl esterase/lipase
MESLKSKFYKLLLKLINKKSTIKKEFASGVFDKRDCPHPPKKIKDQFDVAEQKISSRNVFTISSKKSKSKKHILFLHGGAYIHNLAIQHWNFLTKIMEETGCSVTIPDYPLAPTFTYKDSFEMVIQVYREMLENNDTKNIIFMGDSAGGGFALSLAQYARENNLQQPNHLILLSPWLDLSMTNPKLSTIDPKDPFLGIEGLKLAANAYAGSSDLKNYLLSPLFGSINDLGKISVFTGTHDILYADAVQLKEKAKEAGVSVDFYEYPKMVHVWMLLNMPEAKKAISQICNIINH